MTDLILATIGFAGISMAVADLVQAHNEWKPGWALIWRGQIALCAFLLSAALLR